MVVDFYQNQGIFLRKKHRRKLQLLREFIDFKY